MIKKLLIVLLLYGLFYIIAVTFFFFQEQNLKTEWTYKQSQLETNYYAPEWYFIGSSRTWLGVNSYLFGSASNQSVYNLSCTSFFMPSNWTQLRGFLGRISRKKLIVELSYNISSLDYYPSREQKEEYFRSYLKSFQTREIYSSPYPKELLNNLTRSSFIVRNFIPDKFRKQKIENESDSWGQSIDPVYNLIHAPTQRVSLKNRTQDLKKNFGIALQQGEAHDFYLQNILNLIHLARQNQNEIYFYIPTTLNETEAKMIASVWHHLPERNKILTYNDPEFDKLLTEDYLFDEGHLNKKGSQLLTQIIIRQLQSMKVIEESIPRYVSTSGPTRSGSGTPLASTSTLTE